MRYGRSNPFGHRYNSVTAEYEIVCHATGDIIDFVAASVGGIEARVFARVAELNRQAKDPNNQLEERENE